MFWYTCSYRGIFFKCLLYLGRYSRPAFDTMVAYNEKRIQKFKGLNSVWVQKLETVNFRLTVCSGTQLQGHFFQVFIVFEQRVLLILW